MFCGKNVTNTEINRSLKTTATRVKFAWNFHKRYLGGTQQLLTQNNLLCRTRHQRPIKSLQHFGDSFAYFRFLQQRSFAVGHRLDARDRRWRRSGGCGDGYNRQIGRTRNWRRFAGRALPVEEEALDGIGITVFWAVQVHLSVHVSIFTKNHTELNISHACGERLQTNTPARLMVQWCGGAGILECRLCCPWANW